MYLQKTIIKKSKPKTAHTLLSSHFILGSDSRQTRTFLPTGRKESQKTGTLQFRAQSSGFASLCAFTEGPIDINQHEGHSS